LEKPIAPLQRAFCVSKLAQLDDSFRCLENLAFSAEELAGIEDVLQG